MKNYVVLGTAFALSVALVNCSKSDTKPINAETNAAVSDVSSDAAVASKTKIGVDIHNFEMDKQMSIAKSVNANYIRAAIAVKNWNRNNNSVQTLANNGFHVILNLNWVPTSWSNTPFPTNLNDYRKKLGAVVDNFRSKPDIVVIENEELNQTYHNGSEQDYINELEAATAVCHARGLKVANGGLPEQTLNMMAYKDMLDRGLKNEAEQFANLTLSSSQKASAKTGNVENMRRCATLFRAYKKMSFDYINAHIYQPFQNYSKSNQSATIVLQKLVEYLERVTGKPVISNEMGQTNISPDLVTSALNDCVKAGFTHVLWISNDGRGNSKAFVDSRGRLLPNGVAVKNFLRNHNN